MMKAMKRTEDQLKVRQNLCRDLMDAVQYENNAHTLLETIIDELVYRCNEDEVEEWQKILAEEYGYDDDPEYIVR